MPPQNASSISPGPSPTLAVRPIVAAASSSHSTSTTSVIIGVSVGVGCLVLLVAGYRIWICMRRRPKAPLPPKGPLAYDRQRQMENAYARSELQTPQSFAPFTRGALFDHSRQASFQTDDSSIPPSSPSMSSQAHLVQTPPGSDVNGEITRQRRPSFGSTASPMRHQYSHRKRTSSNAGSVHSTRSRQSFSQSTIRGAPHARYNRVDIVLPQPLAPGLYNNNGSPRQSRIPHSRASSRETRSESRGEDYWTPRASIDGASSSTHESVVSSNQHHSPARYPPPVPPLPAGYSTASSATTSPGLSESSSPLFPEATSPNSSGPLLSNFTPSPKSGPPPLPPPKDPQPPRSSRTRKRSESAQRP